MAIEEIIYKQWKSFEADVIEKGVLKVLPRHILEHVFYAGVASTMRVFSEEFREHWRLTAERMRDDIARRIKDRENEAELEDN